MISPYEATCGVWLRVDRGGCRHQLGDYSWFEFDVSYRQNLDRGVLRGSATC
jgi:hypothetical protein